MTSASAMKSTTGARPRCWRWRRWRSISCSRACKRDAAGQPERTLAARAGRPARRPAPGAAGRCHAAALPRSHWRRSVQRPVSCSTPFSPSWSTAPCVTGAASRGPGSPLPLPSLTPPPVPGSTPYWARMPGCIFPAPRPSASPPAMTPGCAACTPPATRTSVSPCASTRRPRGTIQPPVAKVTRRGRCTTCSRHATIPAC